MRVEIYADLDADGQMSDRKKREVRDALKTFAGKRVVVSVDRKYNRRSNSQNRFFHGVVLQVIGDALIEAGYNEARSAEWVKDFVKVNCLTQDVITEDGQVFKSIRKTSELTTSEFNDLIATVQQWAAENLGVYVPDPNEQLEIEL